MGSREVDHLMIGGGLAAASCARALREEGATGSILLAGREPDPPYNRPPLSKGYLQGSEDRASALFRPEEWWAEQEIDLLTRTSVMKLDPAERVATLSGAISTASTTSAPSATPTPFARTPSRPSRS
jgi:3-phenylpropionate/trans-cinnamate dioxygenase ferredoxin reductase subunit